MTIPGWDDRPLKWGDTLRVEAEGARGEVEVALAGVNTMFRQLAEFAEDLRSELLRYGFEALARIQERTPVDTGRARNSWHLVPPNSDSDGYTYRNNPQDKHGRAIPVLTWFGGLSDPHTGKFEVLIGSNVVYMIALEAGHSRQAPAGMVAITLAEIEAGLAVRLERLLQATVD